MSFFRYPGVAVLWPYAGTAALFIVGWILQGRIRYRIDQRNDMEALRAIFGSQGNAAPELKRGGRYGFPSFELIFPTEADLHAAETAGQIARFKAHLQARYIRAGSTRRPFDAELAVYPTWVRRSYRPPESKD